MKIRAAWFSTLYHLWHAPYKQFLFSILLCTDYTAHLTFYSFLWSKILGFKDEQRQFLSGLGVRIILLGFWLAVRWPHLADTWSLELPHFLLFPFSKEVNIYNISTTQPASTSPASGFVMGPGFKRFLDVAHTPQATELTLVFYLIWVLRTQIKPFVSITKIRTLASNDYY